MSISKLIGRISRLENFKSGSRATSSDIAAMEDQLRMTFPKDYQEFLSELGFARWFGDCVFGFDPIGKTKHLGFDYDVLRQTHLARTEKYSLGFRDWLSQGAVVNNYSGGGYFVLRGQTEGGDVLLLDMDEPDHPHVWPSFEAYLDHISAPRKKRGNSSE